MYLQIIFQIYLQALTVALSAVPMDHVRMRAVNVMRDGQETTVTYWCVVLYCVELEM